eukprot:scaffold3436_cov32-Tisochrysis_lutea.AAC.3
MRNISEGGGRLPLAKAAARQLGFPRTAVPIRWNTGSVDGTRSHVPTPLNKPSVETCPVLLKTVTGRCATPEMRYPYVEAREISRPSVDARWSTSSIAALRWSAPAL